MRALVRRAGASDSAFEEVREPALRAAATATQVLEGTTNLSVSVIVGQIRSTATDLLTGTGYTYEEATDAVREAVGRLARGCAASGAGRLAGRAPEGRAAADRGALERRAAARAGGAARAEAG